MVIDGRKIAGAMITELKNQPKPKRFLAVFLVGDDSSSVSFIKQKEKIAKELGIDFRLYKFPETIKQDELRKEVLKIARHQTCGGVVVQLPLPEPINKHYILNVIPREKDIDVLGERALGAFYANRNYVLPPAVGTLGRILKNSSLILRNKKVAVIGLGLLVGQPIANWLMGQAEEVLLLDKGSDLKVLKEADLVISGVGQANLFGEKDLKDSVLVVDFGYDSADGKISGDFDASAIQNSKLEIKNLMYTPTPGGTGPILVAEVFENFYILDRLVNKY